nr:GP1 [Cuevavirus lloviuense]
MVPTYPYSSLLDWRPPPNTLPWILNLVVFYTIAWLPGGVSGIPLGLFGNNSITQTVVDNVVCKEHLATTDQLQAIGLGLEGLGEHADLPTATKRWGFRSDVIPKIVGYTAGEWVENCYNLEITKKDGHPCLPSPPTGLLGYPRCRYVHRAKGAGPCPGGNAFHKYGSFFLYHGMASTVIYHGVTFTEGTIAFLIVPKDAPRLKAGLGTGFSHQAENQNPNNQFRTTTLDYDVMSPWMDNATFFFRAREDTSMLIQTRYPPANLELVQERLANLTGDQADPSKMEEIVAEVLTLELGDWSGWTTKKTAVQTIRLRNPSPASGSTKDKTGQKPMTDHQEFILQPHSAVGQPCLWNILRTPGRNPARRHRRETPPTMSITAAPGSGYKPYIQAIPLVKFRCHWEGLRHVCRRYPSWVQ